MADEHDPSVTDPGQVPDAAPVPAAPPPAPDPSPDRLAALERELYEVSGRNKQYEAVLANIVQAQSAHTQAMPQPTVVAPQARQFLRQRGLSDEEIDQNAALIGPFLDYAAQASLTPLAQQSRQLQERLDELTAQTEYEDYDVVKDDIKKLQREARERGEPTDMRLLYHQAVAQNVDKVAQARSARRQAATTRAQDASALGSLGGSRAVAADSGPMTPQKFLQLSREERQKVPHAERLKLWNEL